MIVLNRSLTLMEVRQENGRGGSAVVMTKTVAASVNEPSISLTVRAEYVGRSIDLLAVIRRTDYRPGWNYAEVNGVRYRIQSVNPTDKELFVRLVLERG